MITESSIYWILKLDDIRTLFGVATSIFGVVTFISAVVWALNSCDNISFSVSAKRFCIKAFSACAVCAAAIAFIPSTKQMAMIKVLPAIANSEIVGEMSADAKEIYRMGIKAIKEALSENKEQSK
jgi:hypothetical protein